MTPVSERIGLNGPKYQLTPKLKVLKKKNASMKTFSSCNFNNIIAISLMNFLEYIFSLSVLFIESDSFASVSIRQKGSSKKSEVEIMALEKRKLDMLDDNVDNDAPKTKHCGKPKLNNLSCLEG